MSKDVSQVRIVARIRPILPHEREADVVVQHSGSQVSISNPKNENETFTFPFNAVYGHESDQAQVFGEVSPTLKHLFKGNDVTIFAYGATGSGKTHTMKGNKAAAERGIIPRLLTAIYRRGKDLEKKSNGEVEMAALMSYYEIYNDKVFDLFEPPEKRNVAGLPLRENRGKTVVVGLTENEIGSLKDFETYFDQANANRSTSATKLNAHSSRSHAIICVRVVLTNTVTGEVKQGTVSCIDLAGSEDNRRTANDKDRMIESSAINKSLFVLAQCVEAMTKKQNRIPYRESKMTRILSLGQNNGLTVMILNLAPTRAFNQDTLSALNFANRTKKIEFKNTAPPAPPPPLPRSHTAPAVSGAPVRAFGTTKSINTDKATTGTLEEKKRKSGAVAGIKRVSDVKRTSDVKRVSDGKPAPLKKPSVSYLKPPSSHSNPAQPLRPQGGGIKKPAAVSKHHGHGHHYSKPAKGGELPANIEDIVEKKVEEILAARALNEASSVSAPPPAVSDDVARRLELLEKKMEKKADARAEGLTYILLAKQHVARGETFAGLKMYELALDYFPGNEKLLRKVADLKERRSDSAIVESSAVMAEADDEYQPDPEEDDDDDVFAPVPPKRSKPRKAFAVFTDDPPLPPARDGSPGGRPRAASLGDTMQTPRTRRLLRIINSEDVFQIMELRGVGRKRAEQMAQHVRVRRGDDGFPAIKDLEDLGLIKGVGKGLVENMRAGLGEA